MHDADAPAVRAHLRHLSMKGRSGLTVYHRQRALERLSAVLDVPLLHATADDLHAWREALTVADGTAAGYISNVQGFYRWAAQTSLIDADPSAGLPVPATERRVPRPIPSADLARALEMASVKIRPMLILAAWCGMRAKEIAGLRAENVRVNDDPPIILIALGATKGRKERVIDLSDFVRAELEQAALPPARGPVFPNASGHHFEPWMISKICNEHLHACGIPSTLHTLRHWFATQAYAAGYDLLSVQELLGHARPETTAGYAKLNRKRTAAIVNAMPPADDLLKEGAGLRKVMAREAS